MLCNKAARHRVEPNCKLKVFLHRVQTLQRRRRLLLPLWRRGLTYYFRLCYLRETGLQRMGLLGVASCCSATKKTTLNFDCIPITAPVGPNHEARQQSLIHLRFHTCACWSKRTVFSPSTRLRLASPSLFPVG